MARNTISVNIGELWLTIETEHDYPDVIDDMVSRMRKMVLGVVTDLRDAGLELDNLFEPIDDEEEDA